MDYTGKLARLEHLSSLVDAKHQATGDEGARLYRQIREVYGEVADVYESIVGRQRVEVPVGGGGKSIYPNFFEAGWLSPRTIHRHEGTSELLKVVGAVRARAAQPAARKAARQFGTRVFLVHGHHEEALQSVARFLEKLGLPVTILREQPNQGRTIIEKFIDHADVGFAIVLLTADDIGGLKGSSPTNLTPRPRQNVLFELGFFVGILGRERVCALYEHGVEIPSDYSGVAFVDLDVRGAWHLELAREMRAAGLDVDMNNAV
jgi:predicted nucleotide-binding protein